MYSKNILKYIKVLMYNSVFVHSALIIPIVKYSKFYAWRGMINYIFCERSLCTDNGYMTLWAQNQGGGEGVYFV